MRPKRLVPALLGALLLAPAASAGVSAVEASRLGRDLTPMGAEQAGNAEGTIPAWTGGITEPPAGYEPGDWHPDPYAQDPILFTITVRELEAHGDKLAAGHVALLRTYPDTWRMNVYSTRRSASYPKWVYDAVKANATSAELVVEGRGGVLNSRGGPPFPLPRSGLEIVWNHSFHWRGVLITGSEGTAAVTRRGNYRVIRSVREIAFPYGARPDDPVHERFPNVLLAVKSKVVAPNLVSGDGSLIIEPIDQTRDPRKAWTYSRALRRVLRLPHFAYDFPATHSENLRTVDDLALFNGSPDRFEWKLLGKREIYIPYNAYRLHGDRVGGGEVLRVGHIEPELARYELHRVWVVEGRLREGMRHVYSRRVFYVDEDSWQIAVAESYDHEGNLWRVNEAHALNYYEVPVLWDTLQVFHDLKERRYLAAGLDGGGNPPRFSEQSDPRGFSPNALLYYIR